MHGGRRPNAGRPKGSKSEKTVEQEALRDFVFDEVKKNKEHIISALISEAVKGKVPAIKELLDRSLGRVAQNINLYDEADEEFLPLPLLGFNTRFNEMSEPERKVMQKLLYGLPLDLEVLTKVFDNRTQPSHKSDHSFPLIVNNP
jgi:hypothetical protein